MQPAQPSESAYRRARNAMHMHLMCRVMQRRLPFDYAELAELERRCRIARPVFETPGKHRYLLRIKNGKNRFRVVYDTQFDCLVTAWRKQTPQQKTGSKKHAA